MKKVLVKVNWLSSESGGRVHPPTGTSYTTVCKFKGQTFEEWQKNAWSVRLNFIEADEHEANVRYGFATFIAEKAPHELLKPGFEFELFEGSRSVAEVEVLLSEKAVENLVRQMA